MKVNELREIIKKYNAQEREKIIVELYKRIPKNIKENYDIDGFINNLDTKTKKENDEVTIENLEKQVNYFIECADNNLYNSPNKIIPKSERSKWRFKVKKFYKQLNTFSPTTEEGNKATDLLKDLFAILSYGSNYLTFTNWNTFGAIQISQGEFLKNIATRKLLNGVTKENLEYCVELLNVKFDPQGWHKEVLCAFESCLETPESRYMAIELLKEQVMSWKQKYMKNKSYDNEEKINYLIKCIIDIYFDLEEVKKGITYFNQQYVESNREIKEYILLEKIDEYELYDEWIEEYEKHLGKISYRDSLKERYEELKKLKDTSN